MRHSDFKGHGVVIITIKDDFAQIVLGDILPLSGLALVGLMLRRKAVLLSWSGR